MQWRPQFFCGSSPALFGTVVLALYILIAVPAHAALFSGAVENSAYKQDFVYLGKFCFDFTTGAHKNESAGVVSLEIHPLDENKPVVGVNALQLWMYDDEESSWPSIKFKDMGCKERRARARGVFSLARWFDAKKQAMKHAFEISEHQRPRFWWFVLASACDPSPPPAAAGAGTGGSLGSFGNIAWRMHAVNHRAPRPIDREFGVNDWGLTFVYLFFGTLFLVLCGVHLYGVWAPQLGFDTSSAEPAPASAAAAAAAFKPHPQQQQQQLQAQRKSVGERTGAAAASGAGAAEDDEEQMHLQYDGSEGEAAAAAGGAINRASSVSSASSAGGASASSSAAEAGLSVTAFFKRFFGGSNDAGAGGAALTDAGVGTEGGSGSGAVHHLVKLYSLSLVVMTGCVFARLVHYMVFAINGTGALALDRVAEVVEVLARMQFAMLLMLLAAGWTITRATLAHRHRILVTVGCFGLLYLALLVTKFILQDSQYVYVPIGLVVLLDFLTCGWLFLATWFIAVIVSSYRNEYKPEKKAMYARLGVVYAFWLVSEPLYAILVVVLAPWVRDKAVETVSLATTFFAFAWMGYMFWPSRSKKYFMLEVPDVYEDDNSEL